MLKYNYKDWLNGDITLAYAKTILNSKNKPKITKWEGFYEEDIIKIKEKQKEVFNEIISLKLENLKTNFKRIYAYSQVKEELIETEKQECINILYSPIPESQTLISKKWKVLFETEDLREIQNYFKNTILEGNFQGYDFIQSPNDIYQDSSKTPPQIYAQLLFYYFKWLTNIYASEENNKTSETLLNIHLTKNLYPHIFTNDIAYNIFIELKNLTVGQKTQLADYSFIYHKMKKKSLLIKDTKHKTFINLLNDSFGADISAIKLPFKNQSSKNLVFSTLLDKYQL